MILAMATVRDRNYRGQSQRGQRPEVFCFAESDVVLPCARHVGRTLSGNHSRPLPAAAESREGGTGRFEGARRRVEVSRAREVRDAGLAYGAPGYHREG